MKTITFFGIVFLLFLYSCSEDSGHNIAKIEVDFVWELEDPQRSPEIHLSNIPNETNFLDFQFFDATNEWEHGGGSVLYNGSSIIPAGTLSEFKGVSSTWGIPKIRLIVKAFNKNNQLIGKGAITKRPPEL
ncbi:hypothetical protein [uncultured Desulfosarcina sp.]|uniref:hypothetical protein n=1 Tax=uncultured Desulfosarcina sp. TaxID=218289 RepID=UPI0029C65627|nr:hypothetical protein [uncultured Desulfosarcina sp.]